MDPFPGKATLLKEGSVFMPQMAESPPEFQRRACARFEGAEQQQQQQQKPPVLALVLPPLEKQPRTYSRQQVSILSGKTARGT